MYYLAPNYDYVRALSGFFSGCENILLKYLPIPLVLGVLDLAVTFTNLVYIRYHAHRRNI